MLVIERLRKRVRRCAQDDSGAVLVTIVVIMFVGFIIAATIAASVMFTIGANHDNKDNTDAFIAAESGRDEAYESLKDGCSSLDSGAAPVPPSPPSTVTPGMLYAFAFTASGSPAAAFASSCSTRVYAW